MSRRVGSFLNFLLFTTILYAQDQSDGFLVYGKDYLATVQLSEQWIDDMNFATHNGLNGFFYIKDAGLQKSPAAIMLRLVPKRTSEDKVENYINWDLGQYATEKNGLEATPIDGFENQSNNRVIAYKVTNRVGRVIEYTVYLETPKKYFVSFLLQSHEGGDLQPYLETFRNAVKKLKVLDVKTEVQEN